MTQWRRMERAHDAGVEQECFQLEEGFTSEKAEP